METKKNILKVNFIDLKIVRHRTLDPPFSVYISLFLNKPLQYIGIENYKTIYKYIHVQLQLLRNRNGHRD
jgi:hypothetical protein